MHNGFINIDNTKMSKSLGNFFTVRDVLKEYESEDVRMLMLSAHYRSPLNFSRDMMAQARASLTRLYTARDRITSFLEKAQESQMSDSDSQNLQQLNEIYSHFSAGLESDFNTAEAMGALFELAYLANTAINEETALQVLRKALDTLNRMTDVFGILTRKTEAIPAEVQQLAALRAQARKDRNWAQSDALRVQLADLGWLAEDTPQGQKLRQG
jgi:cysteinyl-tRNA synthetase